jgi:hypothetical protein
MPEIKHLSMRWRNIEEFLSSNSVSNSTNTDLFAWTVFYKCVGRKLLSFRKNRTALIKLITNVFEGLGLNNPLVTGHETLDDVMPFHGDGNI